MPDYLKNAIVISKKYFGIDNNFTKRILEICSRLNGNQSVNNSSLDEI